MTRLVLRTPSRLHFGLLSWGPDSARQFGGLGLMIRAPGLEVSAEPATRWGADGPSSDRALRFAERIAARLAQGGMTCPPARLVIHRAPREHVGLGVGTQLGLTVARLLTTLSGRPDLTAFELAVLAGRGRRSGVGLHGFAAGGLVVDGGRGPLGGLPPRLARLDVPPDWSILLVIPGLDPGLHGADESRAFDALPPIPEAVTDRLCRLALLGLLPAVAERDLPTFGAALGEVQRLVGQCFAPAQGGIFARPELAEIADALRAEGLHGVGQSSWGPTLYGFSADETGRREEVADRIRRRFGLDASSILWTSADNAGAAFVPT